MLIRVQVKPNSNKDKVVQLEDGGYLVKLRAKPIDGQANTALIKLLAKHFSVSKSQVTIKNGAGSRWKTININ